MKTTILSTTGVFSVDDLDLTIQVSSETTIRRQPIIKEMRAERPDLFERKPNWFQAQAACKEAEQILLKAIQSQPKAGLVKSEPDPIWVHANKSGLDTRSLRFLVNQLGIEVKDNSLIRKDQVNMLLEVKHMRKLMLTWKEVRAMAKDKYGWRA